jgi:hypothetical protein
MFGYTIKVKKFRKWKKKKVVGFSHPCAIFSSVASITLSYDISQQEDQGKPPQKTKKKKKTPCIALCCRVPFSQWLLLYTLYNISQLHDQGKP